MCNHCFESVPLNWGSHDSEKPKTKKPEGRLLIMYETNNGRQSRYKDKASGTAQMNKRSWFGFYKKV